MTQVTSARLETLSRMVADGSVKAHVDRTFPLDKVKEAFLARESGHLKGKIVLEIKK
jgi:NADPH2:quinone reductase